MNIGNNIFKRTKISLPHPKDNKTTASLIFYQFYTKISQLKQKEIPCGAIQKGVTQKIFSQELRFKDENGKDYPEWEWKLGNKLFVPISNKTHNSDLPILAISQEFGAVPREMIKITKFLSLRKEHKRL